MEEAWFSETLVFNHHTTWQNNSENHEFYLHFHEDLKSYMKTIKMSGLLTTILLPYNNSVKIAQDHTQKQALILAVLNLWFCCQILG
jgi:hypothetical protein